MGNWSGADMRCPTCNKYMPDRCTCAKPTNLAAQASDEPMLANLELVIARLEQIAGNFTEDPRNAAEEALVCARAVLAAAPRATADVERDAARYRFVRNHPRVAGVLVANLMVDRLPLDESIDAAIAATKGAKP